MAEVVVGNGVDSPVINGKVNKKVVSLVSVVKSWNWSWKKPY
jgi:hypothetical protein